MTSPPSAPLTSSTHIAQIVDNVLHPKVCTSSVDSSSLLYALESENSVPAINNTTLFFMKYITIIHHPQQITGVGGKVSLNYISHAVVRIYHINIFTHRGRGTPKVFPFLNPLHPKVCTSSVDSSSLLYALESENSVPAINNTTLFFMKYITIIHHPQQITDVGGKVSLNYISHAVVRIYHINIFTHRGRGTPKVFPFLNSLPMNICLKCFTDSPISKISIISISKLQSRVCTSSLLLQHLHFPPTTPTPPIITPCTSPTYKIEPTKSAPTQPRPLCLDLSIINNNNANTHNNNNNSNDNTNSKYDINNDSNNMCNIDITSYILFTNVTAQLSSSLKTDILPLQSSSIRNITVTTPSNFNPLLSTTLTNINIPLSLFSTTVNPSNTLSSFPNITASISFNTNIPLPNTPPNISLPLSSSFSHDLPISTDTSHPYTLTISQLHTSTPTLLSHCTPSLLVVVTDTLSPTTLDTSHLPTSMHTFHSHSITSSHLGVATVTPFPSTLDTSHPPTFLHPFRSHNITSSPLVAATVTLSPSVTSPPSTINISHHLPTLSPISLPCNIIPPSVHNSTV